MLIEYEGGKSLHEESLSISVLTPRGDGVDAATLRKKLDVSEPELRSLVRVLLGYGAIGATPTTAPSSLLWGRSLDEIFINITDEGKGLYREAEGLDAIFPPTEGKNLIEEDGRLLFHTKDNVTLKFNKKTGDFELGSVHDNFALGTQPYKVFLCLLEARGKPVQYKDLLMAMYPGKEFSEPLTKYKVDMMALGTVMRDIKLALGILPKKISKNKNIFQTMRKDKAYRLLAD